MARKLDLIKHIDDKKETLKLAVRVKDLWFVQNRDNSRHMELILLDQKSKNIVFHIRDMSSAVIGCTLWDSYYFKFMSNWRGEPDSYLLVVLLTQAKIKPCSALELMNKMIEVDGEDDPKCFPEDLDALLGCTLAFKLTLSGSADHNPYVDFCVTPTKELLFDFEVDCDHLDDIPSVEFSRSKTKKRMKQDKL
ncbi:hypothetical protein DEO72_LG6g1984 [Vigna unguiculata]|uniref:Nucleic acid-binding n=1 Tax=Vigna unguiculata TaxID=3917 RepID=A0A4D6MBY1_VIGUN|nr:hypothetical protein DEO72_LG6g1984 [Vigna unguiculata]